MLHKQERLKVISFSIVRNHDRFPLKQQISLGSSGFILGLNFLFTRAQFLSWLAEESFNNMPAWHGNKWWDFYSLKGFFLHLDQNKGDCMVTWWDLKVLATLVFESHMSNQTKSQSLRSHWVKIHQAEKQKLQRFLGVLGRLVVATCIAMFIFKT